MIIISGLPIVTLMIMISRSLNGVPDIGIAIVNLINELGIAIIPYCNLPPHSSALEARVGVYTIATELKRLKCGHLW
jgi:hypothetical protein